MQFLDALASDPSICSTCRGVAITSQTFGMELFAEIVNGLKPSPILQNKRPSSMFDEF